MRAIHRHRSGEIGNRGHSPITDFTSNTNGGDRSGSLRGRPRFVTLDFDLIFAPFALGDIVGGLHPYADVRRGPEGLPTEEFRSRKNSPPPPTGGSACPFRAATVGAGNSQCPASPNTRHLAAPRTVFVPWRVVLFWASLNARRTLALRGDAGAGLLPRPFRTYPGGSSYPGFRFAPPMGYDPAPLRGLTALGSKLEGPK